MSARNPSDSSDSGSEAGTPPVLQPEKIVHESTLEVIWSSPVSTGTGLAGGSRQQAASVEKSTTDAVWPNRHVFAFESDLLDHAFVHWNHDNPTLEMIPGFKQDAPADNDYTYPATSIASGLAIPLPDSADDFITTVDAAAPPPTQDGDARPFQPDLSQASGGPTRVREDGIEDPLTGWRPTGMVFFETLSTPPRGTVYSSSMLEAFKDAAGSGITGYSASLPELSKSTDASPFFDFPETVAPAPPDETDEFMLDEVVIKGGGGGGSGITLFRLFGKLVLLGLVILLVGLIAVGGSYAWYVKERLYNSDAGGGEVTFTVNPGQGFRSIIDNMHADGILKSFMGLDDRYIMRYLAYAYENSDKIKPGVYRFGKGQNLNDVYNKLISGSKDFKITIPEGKTAREIGELVASQYKNFDAAHFMELVNDPQFIHSVGIEAQSLEGYLYPSTYFFGPGMKEEELVKLMVATFEQKLDSIKDQMTSSGMTLQEHVIMASLIEREARLDEDRPLIASVIYNRLEKGIPLQIDATVNYALGSWRRLNNSDYKTDHPYNTYQIKGLPPGPITSPRIESLLATYQAPETDYLYYVHKGDGHHAFAKTYPQHLANVGRYIREKNGSGMGNTPTQELTAVEKVAAAEDEKAPALAGEDEKAPSVASEQEGAVAESDAEEAKEPAADIQPADFETDTDAAEEPDADITIEETEKTEAADEADNEAPAAAPKSY